MEVKADYRITGLLSWTKFIMPDTMKIEDGEVSTSKKTWFGAKSSNNKIRSSQVASVRNENGFFWSKIIIETTGGATKDMTINWVPKKKTKEAVELIQEMISNNN